jgi:hypothetical protein
MIILCILCLFNSYVASNKGVWLVKSELEPMQKETVVAYF